ncbi:MAG: LysM domain-containing protein [Polaromonas sp.]|nr:LysM domain-containing protein [Polaromonas sp.]
MGLEDNLGVSVRSSAWLNDSPKVPGSQAQVASAHFGQAFSQAWPVAARTSQLGPPALSPLTAPAEADAALPEVTRTVASGDTLSGLVKAQAQAQGVQLSGPQIMRMIQRVASDNKITNVNRIFPGQQLNMSGLAAELDASLKGQPTSATLVAKTAPAATALQAFRAVNGGPAATNVASKPAQPRHDVLDKTLTRAVAKGFIPPNEKNDVRDKILELAKTHRFNPDDFARMTLMESDGMNPRASNQRCHGIIQFCDGSDRGAASAGYADNPKAILGLSVYQQLHLVDKYFGDVGLKNKGAAGLDDLYLSVLMPSARSEMRTDAPLSIGTNQAKALYEGRDTSAPMTRQSILDGLLKNAADRLGPSSPVNGRLQAIRTAAYEENTPQLQPVSTRLR